MAEEAVGVIESGESGGSLKENVTEADIQRIQENSRQMKKIAQQLQQDKKQNSQLADFLTFLLGEISNENIIKGLYNTFFITIDPKTNIPYFRKNMNDVVVVGLFYPFYLDKADETGVSHYYKKLKHAGERSIEGYMAYLQDLSDNYHDNIPIDQASFVKLLVEIIKEFLSDTVDQESLGKDIDAAYKQIVYENLYLGAENTED